MGFRTIDSHCHLDIIESQGQDIITTLSKSKASGVEKLLQIGIDLESSLQAREIAWREYSADLPEGAPDIYYSIGCHPTEIQEFPRADEILSLIQENLKDRKLSAIGEVGIDLYHSKDTLQSQVETLEKFLDLSQTTRLPVIIHSRDGFRETYEVLKNWKTKVFGVIHCFTYDYTAAKKFVDLGFFISFSGIVAFKNAHEIHEAAAKLPLDAMMIETDSPFLAPPPHRGKRNDPSNLPIILEKIFSLREEPNLTIEDTIYENSKKFLNRKAYFDA